MTKDEEENNEADEICKENFQSKDTLLSLNLESLKEKQLYIQNDSDQVIKKIKLIAMKNLI